jgi:hypothetical protein
VVTLYVARLARVAPRLLPSHFLKDETLVRYDDALGLIMNDFLALKNVIECLTIASARVTAFTLDLSAKRIPLSYFCFLL